MKIFRFSGVRLNSNDHTYAAQFDTICTQATRLAQTIFPDALKAPYFIPDTDKNVPLRFYIQNALLNGEIFFAEIDGKIIGYAIFRDIKTVHSALLEIFVLPEYRKTLVVEQFRAALDNAAFAKYPEGLQLLKVKAKIHPGNISSLRASKNSGFTILAELPFEGLFNATISPMIYLELYPKEVRELLKPQEVQNGRRRNSESKQSNSSAVHISGAIQLPTITELPSRALPDSILPEHIPVSTKRSRNRYGKTRTTGRIEHLNQSDNTA
jgi:RimJ/RimL family protein N-acetyltransferase